MAELVQVKPESVVRGHGAVAPEIQEFLAVMLAGQTYGIPLTKIREILTPPPTTLVPRAPEFVLGVCSVRGQLVTVIDLRRRLHLPEPELTRRARILLTENQDEVLGLLVDEVRHVVRLTENEIEPAVEILGSEVSEYVAGIGRSGTSEFILIELSTVVGA